jgi:hypothetical protein
MGGIHLGKVKLNCIDENIGYWPAFLYSPDLEALVQFRGNPKRRLHCLEQGQLFRHLATFMALWHV